MKNKVFKYSQLKQKLRYYQNQGKKFLDWHLSPERVDLIRGWGYEVVPYSYEITTKPVPDIKRKRSKLLREIHFKNKNGKKRYARPLNSDDLAMLTANMIYVNPVPVKYRIYLQKQ